MAQYNLLGGVNPINPEYEQMQSMLGKGTNWAEYGLRKEALKEQKKANKMNTIFNGINTAFKAYDAYQQSKEFDLKKESQDLINTEREIDIQTKRIELNTKQEEAAEDKEYLDGLMSLLEVGRHKEAGAWMLSHRRAAQRNADTTYSGINSIDFALGNNTGKTLLTQLLPETAEKIRQFDVGESNANYRAQLSANTSLTVARMGLEGNLAKAQATQNAALTKAASAGLGDLFGFGGGGVGKATSAGGYVNQSQQDEYQNYLSNIKTANTTIANDEKLTALVQDLNIYSNKLFGRSTDWNTLFNNGYTIKTTPVKDVLESYASMLPGGYESLAKLVEQSGGVFPEKITPRTNISGQQQVNIRTKEGIVDLLGGMSSDTNKVLMDALQARLDPSKTQESTTSQDNSGNAILSVISPDGRILKTVPINKDQTKVFQDLQDSQNRYRTQIQESIDFTNFAANSLDPSNPVQNIQKNILNTRSRILQSRLGNLNDPSIKYASEERTRYNTEKLEAISSRFGKDPEGTKDITMTQLGMPDAQSLTLEQINQYSDLSKPLTEKEYKKLTPKEREAYYTKIRNTLGTVLQDIYSEQAKNNLSAPDRNIRAQQNVDEQQAQAFINDLKSVTLEALQKATEEGNPIEGAGLLSDALRGTGKELTQAISSSLDPMSPEALNRTAILVNKLLVSLGRKPIKITSRGSFKNELRMAISDAISDTVHTKTNQKGGRFIINGRYTKKTNAELEEDIRRLYDLLDVLSKGE